MDFPSGQTLRGDQLARDETVDCDAVVIGSGAGGAATAWQLSQAGLRVLVMEEGKKFEAKELSTKQSWALRNLYAERGTSVATGNIFLPMPRGRAVGGSTVLNSAICFRTPANILDGWRETDGVAWANRAELDATFAEVEAAIGVTKCHPGISGVHSLLFKQGIEALGLEGDFISRNAAPCIGCGLCQLGCPLGLKGSVDRNLIPFAVSKGAGLLTCTRAASILVKDGAAVGVEAYGVDPLTEQRGRKVTVSAKRVFLCAGAVSTPMLLLRQGLANSSGQVGNNLHVHTAVGVAGRFEQVVDAWHGATQGYYSNLSGEKAVLETFSATPDIYAVQYEAYSRPPGLLRHIASCGCMLGDSATGTVRPGPAEGRSTMTYDVNAEDIRVMKKGMREIARVYFAAGAMEVHLGLIGVAPVKSLGEADTVLGQDIPWDKFGVYASHPMSTCKMSADKAQGVVKPDGETHDVRNLVIADASVFPTSLGVNPQITVMTTAATIARQQLKRGG